MTISNNEEYNEKASNVQNETQTVNGSAHPLKQQIQQQQTQAPYVNKKDAYLAQNAENYKNPHMQDCCPASPPQPQHLPNAVSPPFQHPEALKELEFEQQYGGINGYAQLPGTAAAGYPQQHMNFQQLPHETVIMEVAPGMQIQLPGQDGTTNTYFGPYSIHWSVPYNEPPPIQVPPNYQVLVRYGTDQVTGNNLRIYSVMPIQIPPDPRQFAPNGGSGAGGAPFGAMPIEGPIDPAQSNPQQQPQQPHPKQQQSHPSQQSQQHPPQQQHPQQHPPPPKQPAQPQPPNTPCRNIIFDGQKPATSPAHIDHQTPQPPPDSVKEPQKSTTPPSNNRGGETDEEKKNIKYILSSIEPPIVDKIGLDFVLLKWKHIKSNGKDVEFKEQIYYIVEVQNTVPKSGAAPQWQSVYTGKETQIQYEKLQPGTEYLSRIKARYLNIEGDPSPNQLFSTTTGCPDKPGPPDLQYSSRNTISLKWQGPYDNGDTIREYRLEMANHRNAEMRMLYKGRQKQYTVGDKPKERLRPGVSYHFRLQAVNGQGPSRFSDEVSYKTLTPTPPPPDHLKVRERNSTYLILEWSYPPNYRVTNYILQMSDVDSNTATEPKFRSIHEGKEPCYTVSKLRRATRYRFRVSALTEIGQSNFSTMIEEVTTAECPSQLNKPTLKKLAKMEPTDSPTEGGKQRPGPYYFAVLEWKAPKETGGSPIQEYRVQQRIADRNQSWESKYKGPAESTQIENLPPGSRIEFRVQAVSQAGSSAWSLPELVNTKPGRPKAPKQITIKNIGTNSAQITWSVGLCVTGGAVQQYELQLAETGYYDTRTADSGSATDEKEEKEEDSRIQFKNQNKQARECTLKDLKSGRRYKIHIRTINSGSEKSEWNAQEFTTQSDRPATPDSISVTAVQSEHVSIEWKEPASNGSAITGYQVEICGDNVDTSTVSVTTTRLEQTNLKANTVYKFRVAATNSIGQSEYSPCCSIRTLASIPHIPSLTAQLLYSIPVVRQSAYLKWNTPSDQGSKISGYRVESRWSSDEREYSMSPDETELKINDLEPESNYRFRIQAINERGASPFSDWARVSSRPLPPPAPTLSQSDIQPNSVKLAWTTTGTKYMLQVEKQNSKSFASWKEIYRGEKMTYKATRLQEGTVYRFRILASNDSGDGHFSPPCEIATPRAPAPNLKTAPIVEINDREESAVIGWQLTPHQQLTDLRFKLDLLRDGKIIRTIPNIQKNDFKMENLEREKGYSVRVCAIRNGKSANYSPEAHFLIHKKSQKERVAPATHSLKDALPTIWADDSVTALLLFAFAIVAVLIALCGHHWQTGSPNLFN